MVPILRIQIQLERSVVLHLQYIYETMFERDIEQQLYILWQQRHVSLFFLIKQLLLRQVALQGLAVNPPIPQQGFAIPADQTGSKRFQRLVWDHLHHLQKTQGRLVVLERSHS